VTLLFPNALFAYQLYCWLLLAACNFLVWGWLKKRHPPGAALGAALLFALNPLVLSRAGVVMPEAAYLMGSIGVLLLWEQESSSWAVGAGLLTCYLIRPAAVTLWAAVWVADFLRGRFRECLKSMAIPLAGFLAWAIWCHGKGGLQEWTELNILWSGKGLAVLGKVMMSN